MITDLLGELAACIEHARPLPFECAVALGPRPDATLAWFWDGATEPIPMAWLALVVDPVRAVAAFVDCARAAKLRLPHGAWTVLWSAVAAFDGSAASRDVLVDACALVPLPMASDDATEWSCRAVFSLAYIARDWVSRGVRDWSRPYPFFDALWRVIMHSQTYPREIYNAFPGLIRARVPALYWSTVAAALPAATVPA